MAFIMIPDGAGLLEGFEALAGPNLGKIVREANEWVSEAIEAVKVAPDNTYGNNEEIAAAILKGMDG
jgi:hypothetical protein